MIRDEAARTLFGVTDGRIVGRALSIVGDADTHVATINPLKDGGSILILGAKSSGPNAVIKCTPDGTSLLQMKDKSERVVGVGFIKDVAYGPPLE